MTTEPAYGFARYWRFWWPLALVGLAMPFARVIQNAALARYPDGTTELALFALAQGTFFIPRSAMVFMPQMATVLARTKDQHRRCRRFSIGLGIILALVVVIVAVPGKALLGMLYGIDGEQLDQVAAYLLFLSPLLLLDGMTSYTNGLLVRHERTGWVSGGTLLNLAVVMLWAWLGLSLHWSPSVTIIGGLLLASALQAAVVVYGWQRTTAVFDASGEPITMRALLAFYVPLSITSMMFACSRPTIYAIVGGTADGLTTIAVLRVAFDLGMLFQLPVNQFRHVMVTFAQRDGWGPTIHARDHRRCHRMHGPGHAWPNQRPAAWAPPWCRPAADTVDQRSVADVDSAAERRCLAQSAAWLGDGAAQHHRDGNCRAPTGRPDRPDLHGSGRFWLAEPYGWFGSHGGWFRDRGGDRVDQGTRRRQNMNADSRMPVGARPDRSLRLITILETA